MNTKTDIDLTPDYFWIGLSRSDWEHILLALGAAEDNATTGNDALRAARLATIISSYLPG